MHRDDGLIVGQRRGRLDRLDAVFDDPHEAHVMGLEEGLKLGLAGPLGLLERRPLVEEITEHYGVALAKPIKHLRVVLFERLNQAIDPPGPIALEPVPRLHQIHQRASAHFAVSAL